MDANVQFAQLVVALMSETNEIRDAAEKEYEKIPLNEKGNLLFAHYSNTENNVEVNFE